jgi:hypothetical protein
LLGGDAADAGIGGEGGVVEAVLEVVVGDLGVAGAAGVEDGAAAVVEVGGPDEGLAFFDG